VTFVANATHRAGMLSAVRTVLFWCLIILLAFVLRLFDPKLGFIALVGVVVLFVVVFTFDLILKRKRQQQGPR
jgi:ABC-type protease/lipase transport system fused ATPase/permease subunit